MSANCHHQHVDQQQTDDPRYRKILWIALVVNAVMFVVEITAGFSAQSASLLADAIDFGGDAANYGLSIWALSMATVWRARTAWIKGASMLVFGLFVLGKALWLAVSASVPQAEVMGAIGVLALVANVGVAVLLYAYRDGDANMQSVWLCTRNDAIGNLAVIVAAVVVWLTGTGWSDVFVAILMGGLAGQSGARVIKMANQEIRSAATAPKH